MSQVENHVDISSELYVIKNEARGHAVKDAIYDALVKLNNAKSAPAPSPSSSSDVIYGEVKKSLQGSIQSISGMIERVGPEPPKTAYIQANGTQGVRCGFTPSSTNVTYVIKFADYVQSDSGWSHIYSGFNGMRPGGLGSSKDTYGGNLVVPIGNGEAFTTLAIPKSGYHDYLIAIRGNTVTINIDGFAQYQESWSGNLNCPLGLCCAATDSGITEYGTVKIYGFQIYQNDSLIRDFVPAKDNNNRAGFFDNVSETYFYSETGTDFVYIPYEEEG